MRKVALGSPSGSSQEEQIRWLIEAMAEIERASYDAGEDEDGGGGGGVVAGSSALNAGVRLSLSDIAPVTQTDITGASSVHVHPAEHNCIAPYDTSEDDFVVRQFEIAPVILTSGSHLSAKNYSMFGGYDGSEGEMFFGTGPAWTGDRVVGTGGGTSEVELFRGRLVNKNEITLLNNATSVTFAAREALLLGGFRTIGAGQTEDSYTKRLLSNVYNAQPRALRYAIPTNSWFGDNGNAWRLANADTANRVCVFDVTGSYMVQLLAQLLATSANSTPRSAGAAISLNSITTPAAGSLKFIESVADIGRVLRPSYSDFPGIGYHEFSLLELSGTTDQRTFYGDNGNDALYQSGFSGHCYG